MSGIYNPLKLSVYRPLFEGKSVLIEGAGAVGSYFAEYVTKMGAGRVDFIDFDRYSLENAAKHSCLVRTPEDVERNKAECLAERVKPFLVKGGRSNGINTDLCNLGPEAFSDYDVIVLCLDNYAAKVLFNELWMQIPKERRPLVIMAGTYDEMAQSVLLDGNNFCLRCLFDEKWLRDSEVRTSCSGPQLREIDGMQEIVRTSGLASSMAAHLSAEQFRASVIGNDEAVNKRITYTAYPHLELSVTKPMKKHNCPGCGVKEPHSIQWLQGSVLELTLGEALDMIEKQLGTKDFEISVHRLNYKNIMYSGFIVEDVCHCCGKPIKVMKHEGRTFLHDLSCESCEAEGKTAHYDTKYQPGTILRAFTPDTDEELKKMTLYDLGYPLGAHMEVIQRNGALDFIDRDKLVFSTFACDEDHCRMHTVQKL